MMGERTVAQEVLFYSFNLVPPEHLLRSIDRFVDLSDIREHLRSFNSERGRPSIDPDLMIRMLIIGYCTNAREIASVDADFGEVLCSNLTFIQSQCDGYLSNCEPRSTREPYPLRSIALALPYPIRRLAGLR